MTFEENPILWLLIITMAITWTVFPFVVMHRLKKIQRLLDIAENRAVAAYQESQPEPEYSQPEPEQPA